MSEHLLRETHALLMKGVRGEDKEPGRYRTDQNWIGAPGSAIGEASFVPIAPEHLAAGMNAWAAYLNDETQPDPIVQLAIAHVEFEALHPFRDGNGRLGRMLVPLFLYRRALLGSPSFYMSAYFERHRDEYIERLRAVSDADAWTEWCRFFLDGVADQAAENERKVRAILALFDRVKVDIIDVTRSQHGVRALDYIFRQPVFGSAQFVEATRPRRRPSSAVWRIVPSRHGPARPGARRSPRTATIRRCTSDRCPSSTTTVNSARGA